MKIITQPSLVILAAVLFSGWSHEALSQGQSTSLPFKLQKNGSISMRDAIKITRRPAGSDRITDQALEKIKNENPTRYDRSFRKTTKKIMPPRGDLYANSLVLGAEESHTVVPKNSILHIPAGLERHLLAVPDGHLVLWPHFYKENHNWIQLQEVSFQEARGETPLSESILNKIARSRRIVVAVHRGFPISVLPDRSEKAGKEEKNSGENPLVRK